MKKLHLYKLLPIVVVLSMVFTSIGCSNDDPAPAVSLDPDPKPVGPSLLKINCGGPAITIGIQSFLEDQYFGDSTEAFTNQFVTEIADTDLDDIFLTERITGNASKKGPFSYNIPVSNGTYTVKMYFAEIYWGVQNQQGQDGGQGSRIFGVEIEGIPFLKDFDIFKLVGAARAITKMYDVEVTDGELNIVFEATVDKPKISALEVFGNGMIN